MSKRLAEWMAIVTLLAAMAVFVLGLYTADGTGIESRLVPVLVIVALVWVFNAAMKAGRLNTGRFNRFVRAASLVCGTSAMMYLVTGVSWLAGLFVALISAHFASSELLGRYMFVEWLCNEHPYDTRQMRDNRDSEQLPTLIEKLMRRHTCDNPLCGVRIFLDEW